MASAAFDAFSGGQGDLVVARTRGGLATRGKPRCRYPKVAAVQEGNARMKAANAVWSGLTWPQAEAWNRYAASLPPKTAFDGARYETTGKNVLVALGSKLLQIDPQATLPTAPPTGRFVPPSVTITVGTSAQDSLPLGRGRGGVENVAEGERAPTLPSPKGEGSSVATFTASAPLPPGVLAELLVQTLPNERRSPTKFYKSHAFVPFLAGALTHSLPLEKGWHAAAVRFVEVATGRVGLTMPLGRFEVA